MHTFEFFIEDERYTVPTLELVEAIDAHRARTIAAERLRASSHHLSVEVRLADRLLFCISRANLPHDVEPRADTLGYLKTAEPNGGIAR